MNKPPTGSDRQKALARFLRRLVLRSDLTASEQASIIDLPGEFAEVAFATGVVEARDYAHHVPDFAKLAKFAEFDPAYLLLNEPSVHKGW